VTAIKPDAEMLRLAEKILDQNARILAMNAALLERLAAPLVVYDSKEADHNSSIADIVRSFGH
jgi:hypothetical protein